MSINGVRAVLGIATFVGLMTTHAVVPGQAPVPALLKEAKTAFLVNAAGDQKRFDDLAKELLSWKRLALVDRREEADVTITLGGAQTGSGAVVPIAGIFVTDEQKAFTLAIHHRESGEPLWNDHEAIGCFRRREPSRSS